MLNLEETESILGLGTHGTRALEEYQTAELKPRGGNQSNRVLEARGFAELPAGFCNPSNGAPEDY